MPIGLDATQAPETLNAVATALQQVERRIATLDRDLADTNRRLGLCHSNLVDEVPEGIAALQLRRDALARERMAVCQRLDELVTQRRALEQPRTQAAYHRLRALWEETKRRWWALLDEAVELSRGHSLLATMRGGISRRCARFTRRSLPSVNT